MCLCVRQTVTGRKSFGSKGLCVCGCVSRKKVIGDTHSCIEHLVAEATVKLFWVGLWKDTIREAERKKENTLKMRQRPWDYKCENSRRAVQSNTERLTHLCMPEMCESDSVSFVNFSFCSSFSSFFLTKAENDLLTRERRT